MSGGLDAKEALRVANLRLRELRAQGALKEDKAVRCPECGGLSYAVRTTHLQTLDQRVVYRDCRECKCRFTTSPKGRVLYLRMTGERFRGLGLRCPGCGGKLHSSGTAWVTSDGLKKISMVCPSCGDRHRARIPDDGSPAWLETATAEGAGGKIERDPTQEAGEAESV